MPSQFGVALREEAAAARITSAVTTLSDHLGSKRVDLPDPRKAVAANAERQEWIADLLEDIVEKIQGGAAAPDEVSEAARLSATTVLHDDLGFDDNTASLLAEAALVVAVAHNGDVEASALAVGWMFNDLVDKAPLPEAPQGNEEDPAQTAAVPPAAVPPVGDPEYDPAKDMSIAYDDLETQEKAQRTRWLKTPEGQAAAGYSESDSGE